MSAETRPQTYGWQNAPLLNKLAASQQSGKRGAQLWGVQYDGNLYTIYQETPGGSWSQWQGPDWAGPGNPNQVYELAAAEQNNGCVQFFALDLNLQLWTTSQTSPGGDWSKWEGPNWNNHDSQLERVAASQQGGSRGAQLWALTDDEKLITCYQQSPGGSWTGWAPWPATPENSSFIEITACQQNDGRVELWALDSKQQIWTCWQTSPGGDWSNWVGPNWQSAPPLTNITACQQGGPRGAQIWGITREYQLVTAYQASAGGNWSGWSTEGFSAVPLGYELAAAQQNNGCCQLWLLTLDQKLTSTSQLSPGGNWGPWS